VPDVVDEGSVAAARVQQVELTALLNTSSSFPQTTHMHVMVPHVML
jgi:hypothetical protein